MDYLKEFQIIGFNKQAFDVGIEPVLPVRICFFYFLDHNQDPGDDDIKSTHLRIEPWRGKMLSLQ